MYRVVIGVFDSKGEFNGMGFTYIIRNATDARNAAVIARERALNIMHKLADNERLTYIDTHVIEVEKIK